MRRSGLEMPTSASSSIVRRRASLPASASRALAIARRSANRRCRPASARSSGPGRSSRSRRRAPHASPAAGASADRGCGSSTWPVITAFGSRIRRITAIIETVFPEPDSPTMPTTSPSAEREREPVDRVHGAVLGPERNVEVAHLEQRCDGSGMPNPRIEQCVDEVDDRVCEHDEERGVDDGREDHRQVEVLQGVERQLADRRAARTPLR